MRALVQRVSQAEVTVEGCSSGKIGQGLLLLIGIEARDGLADIDWLCRKISQLRVFNDQAGVMNLSVMDVCGQVLVVSQFTLFASVKKGNRPSYARAAPPSISLPLFERFLSTLKQQLGKPVACGVFGADMRVSLINEGPVTVWLDSQAPE